MTLIARKDMMTIARLVDRRIAVIILLYFSISLTNLALKQDTEWFPLFSFKLFSRISDNFTKYDIVFDRGSSNEHYLLYHNTDLNVFERHNYERWLASVDTQTFDIKGYERLLDGVTTATLVKFSGDYVEAVNHSLFAIETIRVINEESSSTIFVAGS